MRTGGGAASGGVVAGGDARRERERDDGERNEERAGCDGERTRRNDRDHVERTAAHGAAGEGARPRGGDARSAQRAANVVAVELQNLNKLFAATSASSPDAPLIQRRIAEALVEQRKNGTEPGAKAITAYEKLVTSFPTAAKMDEILYDLGLEYEIAGDMTKARKTYYELIRSSPSSTYVPYAYFAFGEIFLQEAKADPTKLPLAEQAHTEVIKYASSPLVPDALWRLGQIADAQGNAVKAKTVNAKLRANFPTSAAVGRIGEAL